eukprot:scaffold568_cov160-Amphora_coffeaeformis.AAC.23
MIGRAGRPGYDTSGTAVIMTENRSKAKFSQMAATGLPPAKSQILATFEEIINAEISQKVITDMSSALNWIKGTLYYAQLKRDPAAHSVRIVSTFSIDTHLHGLIRECFRNLQHIGVLAIREGSTIKPFDGNRIMSQHLVDYATMSVLSSLPYDVKLSDLLKAICRIERLQRPVKRSEKKTLNELHKNIVRFKLDGSLSRARVQDPWQKAFVLLQASIDRCTLDDYTLRSETSSMIEFASRMLSAAEDVGARSTHHGMVVVKARLLRRSLETSLWDRENGDGVLGQFRSLSNQTVQSLSFNGIGTFDDVMNATEESIEKKANRMPPFGAELKIAVQRVVSSSLKIKASIIFAEGARLPKFVQCTLAPKCENAESGILSSGDEPDVTYTLIAFTDRPGSIFLYKRGISKPETITFACNPSFGRITIHLISSMVSTAQKIRTGRLALSLLTDYFTFLKIGLDDVVQLDGTAELYRTVLPDAPKKKARGKKKATELTSTTKASAMTDSKNVPKKSRTAAHTKVTPSPKLNQPNLNRVAPKTGTRQRDGFISDYLSQKAPSKVTVQPSARTAPATAPFSTKAPAMQSVQPSARPVSATSCQAQSTERAVGKRANVQVQEQKQVLPYSPSRQGKNSSAQLARQFSSRRDDKSTFGDQATPQYGKPALSGSLKRDPQTNLVSPPLTSTMWKQARQQQVRAQKHAFARERENPFSNYKHDPNDAESVLDALSQKTPPQKAIIPPESLRLVDTAYSMNSFPRGSRGFAGRQSQHGRRTGSRQQRRFFSQPAVSTEIPVQSRPSFHPRGMFASHQSPIPRDPASRSFADVPSPMPLINLYQGYRQHSGEAHFAAGLAETRADYHDRCSNEEYCPPRAIGQSIMQSPYFVSQQTPGYQSMGFHTASTALGQSTQNYQGCFHNSGDEGSVGSSHQELGFTASSTPFGQSTQDYQDSFQNSGEVHFAEGSVGSCHQEFEFRASSTPFGQSTQDYQDFHKNAAETQFAEGSVGPASVRRTLRATDEDMTQFASAFF